MMDIAGHGFPKIGCGGFSLACIRHSERGCDLYLTACVNGKVHLGNVVNVFYITGMFLDTVCLGKHNGS